MRTMFLQAAAGVGVLITGSAFGGPGERFPIDLEAMRAKATEQFNAADANGDGLVSGEEFAAVDPRRLMAGGQKRGAKAGDRPRKRGGDADRRRKRAEARAEARQEERQRQFDVADADSDGQLSSGEFQGLPAAVRADRQRQMFSRLDADGDGHLSPSEFPSMANRLESLDVDGDGQITRDEMPQRLRR